MRQMIVTMSNPKSYVLSVAITLISSPKSAYTVSKVINKWKKLFSRIFRKNGHFYFSSDSAKISNSSFSVSFVLF